MVPKTLGVILCRGTGIICRLSWRAWFISLSLFLEDWLDGGKSKSLGGIAASPGMFWELNIYYDRKGCPAH
jgi:hypothetical protein